VLVPTRPVNNGKGPGSDITVDDGGSIILPINKGKKTEDTFPKEGTLPGSTFIDNVKFKSALSIIKCCLKAGETNTWHHIASHCRQPPASTGSTSRHQCRQLCEPSMSTTPLPSPRCYSGPPQTLTIAPSFRCPTTFKTLELH
jgi:hypothetical protein